ncbi:MAG: hypothetical protein M0C28_16175 [Candidatus Moduliflexus flocculans]|nr:hypothetical protein [Candidatus Moduliflexus flocculans]
MRPSNSATARTARQLPVGGRPERRGVVAASSYEARAFGVRSAMSMARAPSGSARAGRRARPTSRSTARSRPRVFGLFRAVTPLVEPLSLDEAYLDVTENAWGEPLAVDVARRLKARDPRDDRAHRVGGRRPQQVPRQDRVGVEEARRPHGRRRPSAWSRSCSKLPVDALWGVGPVTARAPARASASNASSTCASADPELLRRAVGSMRRVAASTWPTASTTGRSSRHRLRKSVGTENTFAEDLADRARIVEEVDRDGAGRRRAGSRAKGLFAKTVTIKVRYGDFTTITRSDTQRAGHERRRRALRARAVALLDRTEAGARPVRLLGVSLHGLVDQPQPPAHEAGHEDGDLPFEDRASGGPGSA